MFISYVTYVIGNVTGRDNLTTNMQVYTPGTVTFVELGGFMKVLWVILSLSDTIKPTFPKKPFNKPKNLGNAPFSEKKSFSSVAENIIAPATKGIKKEKSKVVNNDVKVAKT
jgi:hypothetical protein